MYLKSEELQIEEFKVGDLVGICPRLTTAEHELGLLQLGELL